MFKDFIKLFIVIASFTSSIAYAAFIQTHVLRIDGDMNVSSINGLFSGGLIRSDIDKVKDFHHIGNGTFFALTDAGLLSNRIDSSVLNSRIADFSSGGTATKIFSNSGSGNFLWIRAGSEVLQVSDSYSVANVDSFLGFLGINDSADVTDYHRTSDGVFHVVADNTYYTNARTNVNSALLASTLGQAPLDFFGHYRNDVWIKTENDFFVANNANSNIASSARNYFQFVENIDVADVLDHGRFDNGRTVTLTEDGLFSNLFGGDSGNDILNQRIASVSGGGVVGELLSVDYENNVAYITAGRIEEIDEPSPALLSLLALTLVLTSRKLIRKS